MMFPLASSFKSVLISPVKVTTFSPSRLDLPVSVAVVCQGILWHDIHTPPLGIVRKQPVDGHLCTDCLATASATATATPTKTLSSEL